MSPFAFREIAWIDIVRRRKILLLPPSKQGIAMNRLDNVGKTAGQAGRKDNTLRKLDRMNKSLRHQEPDRVPVSDFFWGSFIQRWRHELALPPDANPYYHYDLDWIVTVPNMAPWIR